MARFPDREAEIKALAQSIVTGLAANAADFPTPPVASVALQALLDSFITLSDEQVAAQAAAEQVTATKNAGMEELVTAMRADLRYAEDAVNYDDAKLSALGWGGRAAPTELEVPGQARALEAPQQGEGWVFLDWKKPTDGGAVAAYKIERRERPAGDWMLVSMAIESEATLNNQERGKDLEYRVIATNKAGDGVPSNTVAVVL
ncbi:MAG: fibronectin type III domain-containing protein [Planctomycetes bacterium]|nr:fibronectin type III domain-containing protein [Planctomycetota bacterium]